MFGEQALSTLYWASDPTAQDPGIALITSGEEMRSPEPTTSIKYKKQRKLLRHGSIRKIVGQVRGSGKIGATSSQKEGQRLFLPSKGRLTNKGRESGPYRLSLTTKDHARSSHRSVPTDNLESYRSDDTCQERDIQEPTNPDELTLSDALGDAGYLVKQSLVDERSTERDAANDKRESFHVNLAPEEVDSMVQEIYDQTIPEVYLSLFIYWIRESDENYDSAKGLIREMGLDQVRNFGTTHIAARIAH